MTDARCPHRCCARHRQPRASRIAAEDGYALAATLFEPACTHRRRPARRHRRRAPAIPRRFYAPLRRLPRRARRIPSLTFDYRDIGGSRRGTLQGSPRAHARLVHCSTCRACIDWAARTYPGRPIHWVGHSMGGFATGLAHNNHLIARQLNVATLSGYWGRMASAGALSRPPPDGLRGAARRAQRSATCPAG